MWPILGKLVCTALFLIALTRYRFFYVLSRTYKRDFRAFLKLCKAFPSFINTKLNSKPVYHYFNEVVKKYPQKAAYLFEDEIWTFSACKEMADKIATYFEREGYRKGDSIALLLNNCPDYVCIWLGLSQIGVAVGLVNTYVTNDPLIHSLKIINCKGIIFGENFCESIKSCVRKRLDIKCYQYNRKLEITPILDDCIDLAKAICSIPPNAGLQNSYTITSADPLIYIYTSGTTGLPKAAILTHRRMCIVRSLMATMICNPKDTILYSPLPLYHGGGGILGCGQALFWGSTIVIKRKFSASNYWKDCIKYNCNVGQYIGEMCRYVLASCPEENIKHPVKIMFGNGLKSTIWTQFQQKYNIKEIYEFYACTEGNFGLINIDNKVGSIGFIPSYLQNYSILQLIRYSEVTGEPVRDENGFCIKVGVNEPGLAVGYITTNRKNIDSFQYEGYVDPRETNNKILRNVFTKNDRYFNSGDVFSYDELRYYYFVDRLGDTFRWKGENVSTSEVEAVISNVIGFKDAIVYGVEIPGTEGRAGMVSMVHDYSSLDMDLLFQSLRKNLPSYAIPLFIRFKTALPLTATYKLQKYELKNEGFNINIIKDTVYFYNQVQGKYVLLTTELYSDIINGKMRL